MSDADLASAPAPDAAPTKDAREADILIVGAGFSGMIMAIEARRRGFTDIAILEKADEVGGTWRENTYPGVACDVPSHLYSIAAKPKGDWSRVYAGGGEIQEYLRGVAREEKLYDLIHFGREMTSARWDDAASRWVIETKRGETWRGRVFVSAPGPLHIPSPPDIEGIETFAGDQWHSAEWRHDVDLAGRRIAVIGTGASAIQFVPEIAKVAGHVDVHQRTAPWILPKFDGEFPAWQRALHTALPPVRMLRRWATMVYQEMQHPLFVGRKRAVRFAEKMALKHMQRQIPDAALRDRVTPRYRIGCKRILPSNDWYPALMRPNVDLVTDPIVRITPDGVQTKDGTLREADVLIYGTGFHVTDSYDAFDIRGRNGLELSEAWADGMKANLGTAAAGFPNMFFMLGPNTGLGHNSVVLMIEAQVEHVCRVLEQMKAKGIEAAEARADRQEEWDREIQGRLDGAVWAAGGCASWYQDRTGRVAAIWPGNVREFQKLMRSRGLEEYQPAEAA